MKTKYQFSRKEAEWIIEFLESAHLASILDKEMIEKVVKRIKNKHKKLDEFKK